MATPAAVRAPRAAVPQRKTAPRPAPPARASRAANVPKQKTDRHRRTVVIIGAFGFAFALLVVAASQAMVASDQVHLDDLTQQVSAATALNENLQLQKAQLAAPSRILKIAEKNLHMIAPANVTYLSPVNFGPTLGERSGTATK